MKLNTALAISAVTFFAGFFFHQPYLWVPLSVLVAAVVDLFTRRWIFSDRLGRAVWLSTFLKLVLTLIGFYAMIGQVACIALVGWWIFF